MTSWHSYPSIYNLGHAAVKDLFTSQVIVQEKIDGSQFSFGVFGGDLKVRSKGQEMSPAEPQKMFARAVETVKELQSRGALVDGWTYRGEVLDKPKHNVLAYNRVPVGNVILFDINKGEEDYLDADTLEFAANAIGLEVVPTFGVYLPGSIDIEGVHDLLDHDSILGGQKVEGIVVKSLSLYGPDKKRLMGKYVSEAFKEDHAKTWNSQAGSKQDVLLRIVDRFHASARWQKAVQHLRERGTLLGEPRDIPALMQEVQADLFNEESAAISAMLFEHFKRDIGKGVVRGLPEWWKGELLKQQFAPETGDEGGVLYDVMERTLSG